MKINPFRRHHLFFVGVALLVLNVGIATAVLVLAFINPSWVDWGVMLPISLGNFGIWATGTLLGYIGA